VLLTVTDVLYCNSIS